jgi:hypothetical protein
VRFTTRDIISPSYFDLYHKSYLQPATVGFDYLLKMYDRADVRKEVDTFKRLRIEMEANVHMKDAQEALPAEPHVRRSAFRQSEFRMP